MSKKDKIIQSAMKLFGSNGYEKTSVEEIIKDAEVSKGLLFHYFTNKEELYIQLYEMAFLQVKEEVTTKINSKHTDFFELVREAEILKAKVMKASPYLFDFMKKAYYETNIDIANRINTFNQENIQDNSKLSIYQNLDMSKFRDGVDFQTAFSMIVWLAEGYMKNVGTNLEMDAIIKDFDRYLEILKWGLYKEEYAHGNH